MSGPLSLFTFVVSISIVTGHGTLSDPPPRGLLPDSVWRPTLDLRFPDAPMDALSHFPSGDKSSAPGSGLRSQIMEAKKWTPFQPMLPGFRWRAGVCGDLIDRTSPYPQDHLRGGQFYYGAATSRTYHQGAIIPVSISLIVPHNGYAEVHICDVSQCGGEMSADCFRKKGACQLLQRAFNKLCGKFSKKCGPIDRKHPSRFYFPCPQEGLRTYRKDKSTIRVFGGPYFTLRLPKNLRCRHCVLHYYWVTGNTCNPPGTMAYFDGPDRPRGWGKCPGQAGAVGGVARTQAECSQNIFPEEYYQCADVRILGKGEPFLDEKEKEMRTGRNVRYVSVVKRGKHGLPITVGRVSHRGFKQFFISGVKMVDLLAVPRRPVRGGVRFYLGNVWRGKITHWVFVNKEEQQPFYIGGSKHGRPLFWNWAIFGKKIHLKISAGNEDFACAMVLR